jgi:hypothetical protein
VLVKGRIVRGIGGAGRITLTVVVVTDIVTLRQRVPWIAVLNVMWTVGSVSRLVVGGAFVQVTWVSRRRHQHYEGSFNQPASLDLVDQCPDSSD